MDCLPMQRSPGPFHYLIHEQAKSLVALQELQNEVGALLEFRDLVIETFPHLRTKMAALASSTSSTSTSSAPSNIPIPLGSSLKREWEPGVKVRRKLQTSKDCDIGVPALASVSRNRLKNHTQQPKSGECINSGSSTGSSAVQDSGFGTETSSSKEHCLSTTVVCSPKISTAPSIARNIPLSSSSFCLHDAEDELWNLLDVIHQKGSKLREEVEHLHQKLQENERLGNTAQDDACQRIVQNNDVKNTDENVQNLKDNSDHVNDNEIPLQITEVLSFPKQKDRRYDSLEEAELQNLRHERDVLLDKLAEMEAETVTSRIKTSQLQSQVGSLIVAKRDLEEQLKIAISQRSELNSRIQDLHLRFVANKTCYVSDTASNSLISLKNTALNPSTLKESSSTFLQPSSSSSQVIMSDVKKNSPYFTPINTQTKRLPKNVFSSYISELHKTDSSFNNSLGSAHSDSVKYDSDVLNYRGVLRGTDNLGALDGIISSPVKLKRRIRGTVPNPEKILAILQELNPVELQRHLLTTYVEKEALERQLKQSVELQLHLAERLDKIKDENEDLRFQLEEKNIELEGTHARVRVLERIRRFSDTADDNIRNRTSVLPSDITCNPVIPMLALPMPVDDNIHHSSSTESAHDHEHGYGKKTQMPPSSPRRRPSKIPLLGSKANLYLKHPTGKAGSITGKQKSPSFSGIGKTGKDTWKNHSDSHLSIYESKSQDLPSAGKNSRDSFSRKSRSDSLSKRSGGDSMSSSKVRDSSVSSNASVTNKHELISHKNKDGSFRSPGTRKNLHHQSSARFNNTANSSRSSLLDHGDTVSKVRPTKLSFWSNWLKILDNGQ